MQYNTENKRIAKNTLLLYTRMLLLTIVSLYTVRITLKVLGNEDFGIFNVVASVVTTLSFLTGTMTSATQRFLSFNLGQNNEKGYNHFFNLTLLVFGIISFIILLIGIAIGPWFIETYLVIPAERLEAAKYVFYFSLFTFILNVVSIPYTASIIAYEKMSAFAYISVIDGILKLVLVFLLYNSLYDKMISYGGLMTVEAMIILLLYFFYCHLKFTSCHLKLYWNTSEFKCLLEYTGWNLFGGITGMLNTQGQNILLNIFWGPSVNTAKSIADKINAVMSSFSTNFYMAVSPQIIKSYAKEDKKRMFELAYNSTKYSFFLLYILSIPLISNVRELLGYWLGYINVSKEMIVFTRLILIYSLITVLEYPLTQMIRATGNIRNYQISVGLFTMLFLPISYILFYRNFPPETTLYVLIILYLLALFIRLWWCKKQLNFSIKVYFINIVYPILKVIICTIPILYITNCFNFKSDFYKIMTTSIFLIIITLSIIYFMGLEVNERRVILKYIKTKIKKT